MKKGIIYGRVSTEKQEYDRQVNELTAYAKRNDIEVVRVFTDVSSGKTKAKSRKAAKQMFDFINNEKIDIVLVSELSRLGRSAIDVQNNIHTLVYDLGLNLYIHQQGMNARDKRNKVNPTFKLITDVLANVAQMEREQISERVKSGLEEARRKGKTLGRPTGSTHDNDTILAKYPKVQRKLKEGFSLRNTAKICEVSVNTVRKVKAAMAA
ncbi:MAG: recombinase family protein [Bacteroidota bacterium]